MRQGNIIKLFLLIGVISPIFTIKSRFKGTNIKQLGLGELNFGNLTNGTTYCLSHITDQVFLGANNAGQLATAAACSANYGSLWQLLQFLDTPQYWTVKNLQYSCYLDVQNMLCKKDIKDTMVKIGLAPTSDDISASQVNGTQTYDRCFGLGKNGFYLGYNCNEYTEWQFFKTALPTEVIST